ncbi:MAG TPA: B12-binding domain-containing protein [Gaiellaceae bacterium]
MGPTLNIAALTRRTGVSADTIRKWEQRYGVLSPTRTAGGQRRYTEHDVARVEWLKARLAQGYRIGEAAALLGPGTVAATSPVDLRRELVDAAERSDVRTLSAVVEHALALDTVEAAFTSVLAPALVEIGELWERGDVTVAQEHLASSTVAAALQRLLADARGSVRGVAVAACAPGERHEIGLMMLSVLLRADGWQVAYLGADTPTAQAVALAEKLGAAVLCFSATMPENAAELERELRDVKTSLKIVVGGRGAGGDDAAEAVRALAA